MLPAEGGHHQNYAFSPPYGGGKAYFTIPPTAAVGGGKKDLFCPCTRAKDTTLPPRQQQLLAGEKKGLFRPCRGAKDTTLPGRQQQLLVGEKKGLLCPPTKDMRFMARFWRCLLRSPKYFARARGTLRRAQTLRVRSRLNS